MKTFKILLLVVVLAMLGNTVTVEAKVKKRRSTTKKEKVMSKTKKTAQAQQCALDMVEVRYGGMMLSSVEQVRVERKNGKVVFAVKGSRTDEKEFVIDDGELILKEALAIIEQEKMLNYAKRYELPPEMQPLDGYAWSFAAKLADGRSVESSGSNAHPGEGLGKLRNLLFDRAYKQLGLQVGR